MFYDPKKKKYATSTDLNNAGYDIHQLFADKEKTLYDKVMLDAIGDKYKQFATRWNALQKLSPDDAYRTKRCDVIHGKNFASESRVSKNPGMDESIADWYRDAFPTDSEMADEMDEVGSTFFDVWKALNLGKDVYGVIGADDSIVRERVFLHLSELTGKKYRTIYKMWIASESTEKNNMYNEHLDDPRDWSASEGEVEIVWDTSDFYDEFGIDIGDTETLVIDYDRVDTHDMLLEEIVRLLEDEYPEINVSTDDFVIDNEDEFWEQRGGNPGKWDDD